MPNGAPRPLLVSIIAVLVGIQAVFTVIFGFGIFLERNDNDLLSHVSQSSGELGALGIGALVIGVIQLLVAIGLWRGNDFARIIAGIVCAFQLVGGVYVLIAYEGSVRWNGLWQALFGALILYLLFNRSADRFFASR